MNTLKDFYTNKRDDCVAFRDAARSEFSAAAADLAEAQASYDALLADLAGLERQVKEKRRSLASALMPADIEFLAGELRDLLDQSRNARADLLSAEQQVASLKNRNQLAASQMKREGETLQKVNMLLDAAIKRQEQHESWNKTVADGVLTELAGKATALLDIINSGGAIDPDDPLVKEKEILAEAKQRVTADIPDNLMTRALARGQHLKDIDAGEANLFDGLKEQAGTYHESTGGGSGKTAKFWMKFLQAEYAYRELVLQARSYYEQALALFFSISKSAALTDAEKARITEAELMEDGKAAAALEQDYDQVRAELDAKKFELELAIVEARLNDMAANPEDDDKVKAIYEELTSLETAVAVAETKYTKTHQDNLDLWEASIPDHIWANLVSYDEALVLLTIIKNGDPGEVATAMNNAEKDLVDALEKEEVCMRTNNFLEDTIVDLNQRTEYARNKRKPRLLSAIRGD